MLRKILVVDDAPLIHEMCRIFLARHRGAEVIGATNGVAALDRLAEEESVDLILLDVNMPQMNGLDLLRRLRQDPSHRDIPVLLISTTGSAASVERGLGAGADGFLAKPFQADELNRAIEGVLSASASRRARGTTGPGPTADRSGPWALRQPASGYRRIVCSEPCRVSVDTAGDLEGVVWNLSVRGAYLILATPFPEVGEALRLTFPLPGDSRSMSCRGRIAWRNPPSVIQGLGTMAAGLPPGCGVEFVGLSSAEAERIGAVIAAA